MEWLCTADADDAIAGSSIEVKKLDVHNENVTGIPVLECDYSPKPHSLFGAIEKRRWDHALSALAPEDEVADESQGAKKRRKQSLARNKVLAMCWVVKKDLKQHVEWRLTPLHAAMKHGAPLRVVEELLAVHPDAARLRDTEGNLPLHLAFREGQTEEVIEALLNVHPEGIDAKNKGGMVPLECAKLGPRTDRAMFTYMDRTRKEERDAYEVRLREHEEKLRDEFMDELDEVERRHEEEMVKIKDEHRADVEALREANAEAIGNIKKEHEAEIAELGAKIEQLEETIIALTLEMKKEERDSVVSVGSGDVSKVSTTLSTKSSSKAGTYPESATPSNPAPSAAPSSTPVQKQAKERKSMMKKLSKFFSAHAIDSNKDKGAIDTESEDEHIAAEFAAAG